jgi:hypothetical protein
MVIGNWALATDGAQWILQYGHKSRRGTSWEGKSFVRSTKDVLERCMREYNVPADAIERFITPLPVDFDTYVSDEMPATLLGRRPLDRMLLARRAAKGLGTVGPSKSEKSPHKPRPRQSSGRRGLTSGR